MVSNSQQNQLYQKRAERPTSYYHDPRVIIYILCLIKLTHGFPEKGSGLFKCLFISKKSGTSYFVSVTKKIS